jgi:hypothetical protein
MAEVSASVVEAGSIELMDNHASKAIADRQHRQIQALAVC